MEEQSSRYSSHLFMVRVWLEELGNDHSEWRGKVQYVPTGEVHYFREWSTLLTFLLDKLPPDKDMGANPQGG